MPVWLAIIFSVISGLLLTLISLKLMQILQLSSYRASGLVKWFKRTKFDFYVRYFALAFFCFASLFVFVMCFGKTGWYAYLGFIFFVLISLYFIVAVSKEKQKTPLKYTNRIKRLIVPVFLFNGAASFCLIWFLRNTFFMYSLIGVTPLICPFILVASHYILLPLEKLIARSFMSKASKKLAASKPIIIGITGSYGKTTAKKILATFLSANYKVYASPKSYNTPMGLSKCINEEYKGEEIFIAEMGARYCGDIAYLKKFFKPKYAVITAIGNQHLETFGSIENIIKEKLSILDGTEYATANGDCLLIRQNVGDKAELCGKDFAVGYSDVKTSIYGTDFILRIDEQNCKIHTRLVGEHIPSTIAVCALMARKLGIDLEDIISKAENLPFVDHRLEILKSGDITILDDSFNSNPQGAYNALEILGTFNGKKIVITPGFAELGDDSDECHAALGAKIASVCDYAFLLGPNVEAIKKGMGDFKNVLQVQNLDEAMKKLQSITPPMAVLFENDFPDNY